HRRARSLCSSQGWRLRQPDADHGACGMRLFLKEVETSLDPAGKSARATRVIMHGMANLQSLDLDEQGLSSLPANSVSLHNVEKLTARGNRIAYVRDTIGPLTNLEDLRLGKN